MDHLKGYSFVVDAAAVRVYEPKTLDVSAYNAAYQGPILEVRRDAIKPIVTVHPDGTVEYGPDYNPDEAARIFWEAIGSHRPR